MERKEELEDFWDYRGWCQLNPEDEAPIGESLCENCDNVNCSSNWVNR